MEILASYGFVGKLFHKAIARRIPVNQPVFHGTCHVRVFEPCSSERDEWRVQGNLPICFFEIWSLILK